MLSVHPWVSAPSVMKLYRMYQKLVLQRENRPPREYRLQLFDFVSERRHRGESWREIQEAWNKAHPDLAYVPEAIRIRNFQRDFSQIYTLIMGKPPDFKVEQLPRAATREASLSHGKRRRKTRASARNPKTRRSRT